MIVIIRNLGTIPTNIQQPAFNDILANPININELLKTDLDQKRHLKKL